MAVSHASPAPTRRRRFSIAQQEDISQPSDRAVNSAWRGTCRTPVRFGVVEAINGNIKALLRRDLGYTNLR